MATASNLDDINIFATEFLRVPLIAQFPAPACAEIFTFSMEQP
ncbi:MAG: hypothetical protein R3B49_03265 [Phycisphaerales bacterium]